MRRIRTLQAMLGATVVAVGVTAFPLTASAVAIPVGCSESALVAAINRANATPAPDTLNLTSGCTYRLTSAHGGPSNGLPVIRTSIEMVGPATVTRASSASFRIASVSATGGLTLTTGVAFTNGNVKGPGGGIVNYGAVTLTQSRLTGNSSRGAGGGLANLSTSSGPSAATVTGGSVSNNSSRGSGGGIYNGEGNTLTTTGPTLTGNFAALKGGGLAAVTSAATTLTSTTINANRAGVTAGGVFRSSGVITVTATAITSNTPNNCRGSAPAVPSCVG